LLLIPGTLCLVKNDHVLMRWSLRRSSKALLEEVIDVLDSRAHFPTDNPEWLSPSAALAPRILVSRQGLAKDYHQRRIARKIDNVAMRLDASCDCTVNNVEAGESLSGTRHARKEHQKSFLLLTCCFDKCYETCGC
jgi:hypothetical protein